MLDGLRGYQPWVPVHVLSLASLLTLSFGKTIIRLPELCRDSEVYSAAAMIISDKM